MDVKHKLAISTTPPIPDAEVYRRIVGKLIYLTISRPDIAYSVHILSQFLKEPTTDHLAAAHHLLRYIKSAPGQGIFFPSSGTLTLQAFCDADWAACPLTRRSVTGFCIMLGGSLISWKVKKQATLSRSSCESEYRSLANTSCELVWLRRLLKDLFVDILEPTPLYCDNRVALHIAQNPVFHERTKHIELDCHLVRQHITNQLVSPRHMPTLQQPADLFTKPLSADRLRFLCGKLNVSNFLYGSA